MIQIYLKSTECMSQLYSHYARGVSEMYKSKGLGTYARNVKLFKLQLICKSTEIVSYSLLNDITFFWSSEAFIPI